MVLGLKGGVTLVSIAQKLGDLAAEDVPLSSYGGRRHFTHVGSYHLVGTAGILEELAV
jgi:hypothetical protein